VSEITKGEQAVLSFAVARDARTMVALISTPVMIGGLFTVGENGAQNRITRRIRNTTAAGEGSGEAGIVGNPGLGSSGPGSPWLQRYSASL